MGTRRSWVKGPWPRKLALAARPRGGDWLEDEVVDWRRSGVDAILSLLTPGEERDFGLEQEGPQAKAQATEFTSFPIADRQVPVWRRERPNCWTGSLDARRKSAWVACIEQRSGWVKPGPDTGSSSVTGWEEFGRLHLARTVLNLAQPG